MADASATPGHCEVDEHGREAFDFRYPPIPLTPARKRVNVTKALQEAAKRAKTVTVTIVPVVTAANRPLRHGQRLSLREHAVRDVQLMG